MNRLLFLLFFLSGFSALVYEVVWARQLSLIFGTTTASISSILAVFFLGLAIGSWMIGRMVDANNFQFSIFNFQSIFKFLNFQRPLVVYGLLEFGIGVYAIFTPFIFKLMENFGGNVFLSSFVGLILPTVLMGGTFPVIAKAINANAMRIKIARMDTNELMGKDIGVLYGVNTMGAGLGAFMAGFFLIATLGIKETIWLAAFLNILISLVAFYLSRIGANEERMVANERRGYSHISMDSLKDKGRIRLNSLVVLAALFLTGFASIALEVLWTRVLILFFGASVYAFALVLVSFLIGIGLGSFIYSRMGANLKRIDSNERIFSISAMVLGLAVILTIPLFERLPFWILEIIKANYTSYSAIIFWQFILAFLIMIVPTILMGILFPLGINIYMPARHSLRPEALAGGRINAGERVGSGVGIGYSVNTLGGILGALAAGFLLIPLIGGQKGIWIAGSIYLLTGMIIFHLSQTARTAKAAISFFTVLAIAIGFVIPSWNKHFMISGPYSNWRNFIRDSSDQTRKKIESSELLYYKEGIEANIAVKKTGKQISLQINGKTDAATGADMDTQVLSGQLPMILHKNPKNVLVVGLGSGITLGSVQTHSIDSVEAVEIEPKVFEAAKFFKEANYNALEDKRLKIIIEDGRHYLSSNNQKYDVITSEPSNVWLSGNSKLFTKEYFELAKARLNEGGIFAHWIQLYSLESEDLKIAIKTFQSVFPNTLVFDNLSSYDLLLVGSQEPLNFDFSSLEEKFKQEKVRSDLQRIYIENPSQLLSYIALDSNGALQFSRGSRENTDNNPYLEFSAPKSLYIATTSKNIESFKDFRPNLFPNDQLWQKYYLARREITLGKMYFTRGELDNYLKEYEEAVKIDSGNMFIKSVLADFYLQKGEEEVAKNDLKTAEDYFLKAITSNPGNSKAHLYLGTLYKLQGRLEEAKEHLPVEQ